MDSKVFDALVIGGGPGGATAATLLAQRGRTVLLVEKEIFPRFHIGESLLPYNRPLFEELGVLEALEQAGFPRKFGAQFHLGNGSKALKLIFRTGRFTREPMAFQVERSIFDEILLRNAQRKGVEVREGWTFQRRTPGDPLQEVELTDPAGRRSQVRARYVIDASGRANVTGNQAALRVVHPRLQKVALFAHYTGVRLDAGESGGDTVIVRLADKWFWLIPISNGKTSVGCVMDREALARTSLAPEAILQDEVAASPPLRHRMRDARRIGEFHVTSDFSYYNRRLTDPGLLRVGDAAGFMDPIFSAGVFLAMYSGKLAAETVHGCLAAPRAAAARFRRYEGRVFGALRFYWEMVEQFYTTEFMELFLEPREMFSLPAAVNAALAGDLTGRWAVRWRLRLFFWLVRLQARRPLVPRIDFSHVPPPPTAFSGGAT